MWQSMERISTDGIHMRNEAAVMIISMVIGGSFKGFWLAACPWVLMGIGLSSWQHIGAENISLKKRNE